MRMLVYKVLFFYVEERFNLIYLGQGRLEVGRFYANEGENRIKTSYLLLSIILMCYRLLRV